MKATRGKVPREYQYPNRKHPWTTLKKVDNTKDLLDKRETWMYTGDGHLLIHWADGEVQRIHMFKKGNFNVFFPFCIKADDRDTQTYFLGTTNEEYESNLSTSSAEDELLRYERELRERGVVTITITSASEWLQMGTSDDTGNSTTTERT